MPESQIHIEQELIEQFHNDSVIAFELIFYRTKGKLNGFLYKALPIDEDRDSVLQEIYLKLWSNRKSVKSNKNFEAYFFTIARNIVVDVLRKRFNNQKYLEHIYRRLKEEHELNTDTLEKVEYRELEHKLFELIDQLPEQRRKIFLLNRLDGLTYKEIAKQLNISENTVDTQIRNALSFLRIEMKHFFSMILLLTL